MSDLEALARVPGVVAQLEKKIDELRSEVAELSSRLPPRLLTFTEAAQAIGCSRKHIYALVARRELPVKRLGKILRIDSKDLQILRTRDRVSPIR